MRKVIILFSLIILTVSLSGCLSTQVAQIDQLAEIINEHLNAGDKYFNQAALSTNKYSYYDAQQQCNNATAQYNMAKTSAQEALIYSKNIQNEVYIDYLQITLQEVDAKLNATNELQLAIPLFMNNDTTTANEHVDLANQYMETSLKYQTQREEIVRENPTKFKS
ncbi:hypothetical protein [Methanobacterium petrolearium]|uniref:hypothetical protein n=1 Tax=Methanobacterium petrolearium TaxID=710190 RepID=UPI001AE39B67|nr:hypothetical protein [Methanobacterium petrolearium]MBP1945432.1 hypothetical protein [Methanobacterium petrolearium]BDZ71630.1 hypothetical protein GCM10025861_21470 [Methanobacterium petrolearium]